MKMSRKDRVKFREYFMICAMLALIIFIGIKSSQLQVSHTDTRAARVALMNEAFSVILTNPWDHEDVCTFDGYSLRCVVESKVAILPQI